MKIAIIGTAGRDKSKPMTSDLWEWMVRDALMRVPRGSHLVSGGAAWADHLAVDLFLSGHAGELTLHFPTPFDKRFIGPQAGAASAANYYHSIFSRITGRNSLAEIQRALDIGAISTSEPAASSYGGMFARNAKVAQSEKMLAYTFGIARPTGGGTLDTWNKCKGDRTHISLSF